MDDLADLPLDVLLHAAGHCLDIVESDAYTGPAWEADEGRADAECEFLKIWRELRIRDAIVRTIEPAAWAFPVDG